MTVTTAKATMPVIYNNDTPHQEPSTAFLEDASFLRMKTLRLGYDLNNLLKNRFSTLQIYFQASNLFTITNYSGLDPELYTSGINMGVDSGSMAYSKAIHIWYFIWSLNVKLYLC